MIQGFLVINGRNTRKVSLSLACIEEEKEEEEEFRRDVTDRISFCNRNGPWFSTQLTLSLTIGLLSFLLFCLLRRREKFKVLYKPRTLLKGNKHPVLTIQSVVGERRLIQGALHVIGFSPHEVHDHESFFGWVLPTLKTSEFVVLQLVGLDAAVVNSLFFLLLSQ